MRSNRHDILTCQNEYIGIREYGGCTLAEYKKHLLTILDEIDRICRANNIEYYVMYGTLLGAVRHGGFIPWDDDADIVMTRENYAKFAKCCEVQLSDDFDLLSYENDSEYNYIFPRLRMKNTSFLIRSEISRHGRNAGFFVDIVLMDYCSRSKVKSFIQKKALLGIHRVVSPGFIQPVYGLNAFESGVVKCLKALFGRKKTITFFEKILTSVSEKEADEVLIRMLLPGSMSFQIYNKEYFDGTIDLSFENKKFMAPHKAISLLSDIYYRKLSDGGKLLLHDYKNEDEAVKSRKTYELNDINFIPASISRTRHAEVVFDSKHPSSYYDENYYQWYDKKGNDRAAVKEQHYRGISRKYLNIMNKNEALVRSSIRVQMGKEYFSELMKKYPNYNDIPLGDAYNAIQFLLAIRAFLECDYDKEMYKYVIGTSLRCEEVAVPIRMITIYENHFDKDIVKEKQKSCEYEKMYYALITQNAEDIASLTECENDDILPICIKGAHKYNQGKYEEAENIFMNLQKIAPEVFWLDYYLGCLAMNSKDYLKASRHFEDALADTGYMPMIQHALDKIKELDNV